MFLNESIYNDTLATPLWISEDLKSSWNIGAGTLSCFSIWLLVITAFLNYIITIVKYHSIQWRKNPEEQLPPTYPSIIPLFSNLISFMWDSALFFKQATLVQCWYKPMITNVRWHPESTYKGCFTSTKISFLGQQVYLFQDRETVKRIWKAPSLSSPLAIQIYSLKYLFGVSEKTLAIYRTDTSGPYQKPNPGSNIPSESRIDYISRRWFLRAFSGPGLIPTVTRFTNALEARLEEISQSGGLQHQWVEINDFREFVENSMGRSLVESIFGPSLLQINPNFVHDLIEFDGEVAWLSRGIPAFINPRPHRLRKNLCDQLKRWHAYARQQFHPSKISTDGDGDPYWGSEFMRTRHAMLPEIGHHDDDALAATDLGVAFG